MNHERITGMVLIAIGVLAMASWLGWSGWLWLAALAAFFLSMYVNQGSYSFLVVGSIVAGLAVGGLLGGGGALLVSLGAGFFAIDRIEPQKSRWPLYLGGVLTALGLFVWLLSSGLFGSVVFAAVFIALGLLLLLRGEGEQGSGRWTYLEPPPKEPPAPAEPTGPAATPGEAEASPESEVGKNAVQGREGMAGKRVEEDSGESKTSESKTSESKTSESKTIKERPPEENAVVSAPPLTDEEAGLYRRLEVWRKAKAAREGKPAYIILTNESLQRIAREKPQTLDALS
ncbi:MAG: HRDC domain-containing protein, partial [Deinococcota bacterium]|nr:HRDC domain-containing protein [Deinococcota bacterium]